MIAQLIEELSGDPHFKEGGKIDVIFDLCNYLKEDDAKKIILSSFKKRGIIVNLVKCNSSRADKRLQPHDFVTGYFFNLYNLNEITAELPGQKKEIVYRFPPKN